MLERFPKPEDDGGKDAVEDAGEDADEDAGDAAGRDAESEPDRDAVRDVKRDAIAASRDFKPVPRIPGWRAAPATDRLPA